MKISIPDFIHGGTRQKHKKQYNFIAIQKNRNVWRLAPGGPKIFDVSEKYKLKFPKFQLLLIVLS